MKDKEKKNTSMKEMITKTSFEPITNCNCKVENRIDYAVRKKEDNTGAFADLLNQEMEELQRAIAIVEMAKIISLDCENKSMDYCETVDDCDKCRATDLYNAGYRKLPEDSIIISREELHEIEENAYQVGVTMGKKVGSKETVEKILNDIADLKIVDDKVCAYELMGKLNKLEKQFGVEIKE